MDKTAQKSDLRSKFRRIFWRLFALGLFLMVLMFVGISMGWIGYLPPLEELQNPKNKYATEIISSDQQLLGRYFYSRENRVGVHYDEISDNVLKALVATEDIRFYDHSGIDGRALTRAVILTGILRHKSSGGGSTITQQLAKLLYSQQAENKVQRLFQKPIEWVIAVKLEKLYTKEEILAMYLNQYDFGNNAVGIKSASQIYFSKTPDKLKIEEAAMLIGMCKNSSYFNPVRRPELTLGRRNTVLNQMRKADFINDKQCDSLQKIPLNLKYQKVDHRMGTATYFRE